MMGQPERTMDAYAPLEERGTEVASSECSALRTGLRWKQLAPANRSHAITECGGPVYGQSADRVVVNSQW